MNADGTGARLLFAGIAAKGHRQWSPDGTRIVFESRETDARGRDVLVARADGGGVARLTGAAGDDRDPAWSPDGARTPLAATPGYDGMVAWAPDGTRLAFISDRDGVGALYVVDAGGARPRRITAESSLNPSWATPDAPGRR